MDLQNELEKAGLRDKEAAVYKVLLEMGQATALQISKQTGINRPTVYLHLESLAQKGLASQLAEGKTRGLFSAEPIDNVLQMLQAEQMKLSGRIKNFESILPLLQSVSGGADKPKVRVFEGREVLQRERNLSGFSREKLVRSIFNIDLLNSSGITEDRHSSGQSPRIKNKVKSRVIYNDSRGPSLAKNDKERLRESIWLPEDKLQISFDFAVWDDRVVIKTLTGWHWGLVIESQQVADSFKQIFDLLWLSFAGKIQNVVRSL
jgi:sugar-specific transcriptional regulator TrmB